MNAHEILEHEINEMAERLQTHVDGKESEYGFEWGGIYFFFHDDNTISVAQKGIGIFRFATTRAVAEFTIFNIIPNESPKQRNKAKRTKQNNLSKDLDDKIKNDKKN